MSESFINMSLLKIAVLGTPISFEVYIFPAIEYSILSLSVMNISFKLFYFSKGDQWRYLLVGMLGPVYIFLVW